MRESWERIQEEAEEITGKSRRFGANVLKDS